MKRKCLIGILFLVVELNSQIVDSLKISEVNIAETMLASNTKLTIGGYGEVHYNQPLEKDVMNNGILDVHRMVMLFGYKFNQKTSFITEIEFEHVSEVYIEQAFLQYRLNEYINFRSGLLLIPMGIINELHEPVTFNGVERSAIDNKITPTTWREIGFGFSGNIIPASLKYQLYLVNGFSSYDGQAKLNGKNGFRNGRQKGAESYISSPNISSRIDWYALRGLILGMSVYSGKTQSTLYNGIQKSDPIANDKADSSVTGINMLGIDARYQWDGLQMRGQYYLSKISNTYQYNIFTTNNGKINDLGSAMIGYYLEAGYNIFSSITNWEKQLIPFVRYEYYDTHKRVTGAIIKNRAYENNCITTGLTLKLDNGAVLKADMQFNQNAASAKVTKVVNVGMGVMF